MTTNQIRTRILELIVELESDKDHAKAKMKEYRGTARAAWYEGVRDAKHTDTNKLRELLDAIDTTKGQ